MQSLEPLSSRLPASEQPGLQMELRYVKALKSVGVAAAVVGDVRDVAGWPMDSAPESVHLPQIFAGEN